MTEQRNIGRTWARVLDLGRTVEGQGPIRSHSVRLLFGALQTVRDSTLRRRLHVMRWSPRSHEWHHRWPEGRVDDTRWWRSWEHWATGGGYDIYDLLFRHYRPQHGDTVVDVGSGHGGETFGLAHMVGPEGRVLSVEAAPDTFGRLEQLCRLNGWTQVEPIQAAIADKPGSLRMSVGDSWVVANVFEGGGVEVPAMTLDDLCAERGITQIDWLKMNIEGAERNAVKGMERMAPHIRNLTISCHDFLGTEWGRSKDEVISWLVAHGFTVAQHGPGEPWARDYVYAWREPATTP